MFRPWWARSVATTIIIAKTFLKFKTLSSVMKASWVQAAWQQARKKKIGWFYHWKPCETLDSSNVDMLLCNHAGRTLPTPCLFAWQPWTRFGQFAVGKTNLISNSSYFQHFRTLLRILNCALELIWHWWVVHPKAWLTLSRPFWSMSQLIKVCSTLWIQVG